MSPEFWALQRALREVASAWLRRLRFRLVRFQLAQSSRALLFRLTASRLWARSSAKLKMRTVTTKNESQINKTDGRNAVRTSREGQMETVRTRVGAGFAPKVELEQIKDRKARDRRDPINQTDEKGMSESMKNTALSQKAIVLSRLI